MTHLRFSLPAGLSSRSCVIVAVSGGCDSLALLRALTELSICPRLVAAHVNYGLRGRQSGADEELVRKQCRQWNVPLRVLRVRNLSGKIKSKGLSLQDEARKIRYTFFSRVAQKEKAWGVAVAHHLEDQAETVLDRFLRGSGAKGLSGLRSVQTLPFGSGLRVWRPLLRVTKNDLKGYLGERDLVWREDESNRGLDYRRNQIRHQVIPFLSKWNPRLVETLSRMGETAAAEDLFLEEWVHREGFRLKGAWTRKSYSCSSNVFQKRPLAFQRRWVRQVAERLNPDARGLSFERVELILKVWDGQKAGPQDIGYGLSASRLERHVCLKNVGIWRRG